VAKIGEFNFFGLCFLHSIHQHRSVVCVCVCVVLF
jgi:hypothetical protein